MTGGQISPTTPSGAHATTTPYGNKEKQFEACDLARGAGASFIARTTVYHTTQMDRLIMEAVQHRGFSLVEVISNCHTYYGRLNKVGQATALLRMYQEKASTQPKDPNMVDEETKDMIQTGIIYRNADKTELCDEYQGLIDSLAKGKPA
jgi:2-oxoglutarate ferredoxin oxidoreductase subunit beta